MTRPFRFGVVAPVLTDLPTWRDRVRRIAGLGYSTLLMPDVPSWQPAPTATLAVAAALETELRIGTWVSAVPLRPAWSLAWEAHSLSLVTDGRFELGIGTGRPGIEDELRERGLPVTTPGQRLQQTREVVSQLRELDGPDLHTPVVMAVRGPKAQALAGELADTVTFALRAADTRQEVEHLVRGFTPTRDVELALHVPVVGDGVAAFMASAREIDPRALHAADSMLVLSDDPAAAIEELQRRRDELGFSYVVIGADFAEAMAPVVAALAGQ